MATYRILVLPGDGIGPEVTAEGVRALEAVGKRFGHTFETQRRPRGRRGDRCPRHRAARRRQSRRHSHRDAVLWGAVGGPKWDDPRATVRPEQGILGIRKALGLVPTCAR